MPGKLSFPSDAITLGQMRMASSHVFGALTCRTNDIGSIDALALHMFEMRFAESAYARATGLPDPFEGLSDEERHMVERGYVQYGLCSGRHQAKELLKGLEVAAAAMGVDRGGKGRST